MGFPRPHQWPLARGSKIAIAGRSYVTGGGQAASPHSLPTKRKDTPAVCLCPNRQGPNPFGALLYRRRGNALPTSHATRLSCTPRRVPKPKITAGSSVSARRPVQVSRLRATPGGGSAGDPGSPPASGAAVEAGGLRLPGLQLLDGLHTNIKNNCNNNNT